jgi:hypothetical protein
MRFIKTLKTEFTDTNRKRAAYRRKCQKEIEKYPLLAFVGELNLLSEDEEMSNREVHHNATDYNDRKLKAIDWKKARLLLRQHPDKNVIYQFWQACSWPSSSAYLADLVRNWGNYKATAEMKLSILNESKLVECQK